MSSSICNIISKQTCFEDLPDEILLNVCRYLSQINILDSLLNLNKRLNKTITSYRERICLSHLSQKDFHHLINNHLPHLASNVYCLYINNCSMINIGKMFEEKFNKIDQQFPYLRQLIFHQIDIETLEDLSWRFNTMNCLRQLNIDIANNRLSSMPIQFDEFLCGKLFSKSNSFESLNLNLNNYQFSLHSIKQQCINIRYLTISVKRFNDLLILFNYFSNIEQLNITISCSTLYDTNNNTYSYEQLWWKVPYLTKFELSIQENELISHDNVIPSNIIIKVIQNLYSLKYCKFMLNIKFSSVLEISTTKEIYIEKYFPYVNGLLWQQALERNDNRSIHFELYIELDGISSNYLKKNMKSDIVFVNKNDDIDFNPLIKTTFSNAFWLQKNIFIQCFSTSSKHVSIYTLPITNSHRITTADIIDQEISVKSSESHINIQSLVIHSNDDYYSLKLSIINLFKKFPNLTYLKIETELLLPSTILICSIHLRSLSLNNYSLLSCHQLLNYLPRVTSLSIKNSNCKILDIDSCTKSMLSITRLKLTINSIDINNLYNITKIFPNVKEFYLIIKNPQNQLHDNFHQYEKFYCFSQEFIYLRYIEIILPIKQESVSISKWINMLGIDQAICKKTTDGNSLILKSWL